MSYYALYYNTLAALSVENALRKKQIQAELAMTRIPINYGLLPREPIMKQLATQDILRRSRVQADVAAERVAAENALRRSRIAEQLRVARENTENALRRSRVAAEIEADRAVADYAYRRQKAEMQIMANRIARRELLQTEIQVERARRLSSYPHIW